MKGPQHGAQVPTFNWPTLLAPCHQQSLRGCTRLLRRSRQMCCVLQALGGRRSIRSRRRLPSQGRGRHRRKPTGTSICRELRHSRQHFPLARDRGTNAPTSTRRSRTYPRLRRSTRRSHRKRHTRSGAESSLRLQVHLATWPGAASTATTPRPYCQRVRAYPSGALSVCVRAWLPDIGGLAYLKTSSLTARSAGDALCAKHPTMAPRRSRYNATRPPLYHGSGFT